MTNWAFSFHQDAYSEIRMFTMGVVRIKDIDIARTGIIPNNFLVPVNGKNTQS